MSFSEIFNEIRQNTYRKCPNKPEVFTIIKKKNEYVLFYLKQEVFLKLFTCTINEADNLKVQSKQLDVISHDQQKFLPETLAEKLLAERMRISRDGVSFYDYHLDSGDLVIKCNGIFYSCNTNLVENNEPKILNMSSALGVQRNPVQPRLLSFVRDQNIFIIDIITNLNLQLTFNEKDYGSGCTHFVIEEEFDRYEGSWWRPKEENEKEYHLLIEEYNESQVEEIKIPKYTERFDTENYRYPRAGMKNAVSNIKILKITMASADDNEQRFQLNSLLELPGNNLFDLFPGYEYLTNAGWTPDGKYVWVQLITRTQNELATYLIPIESFIQSNKSHTEKDLTPSKYAVLLNKEINDKYWVPVNINTHFLKEKVSNTLSHKCSQSVIIGQSITNYNHLYLISKSWQAPLNESSWQIVEPDEDINVPLTSGEWLVKGSDKIWVNETEKKVYFLANCDEDIANYLYCLSYADLNNSVNTVTAITNKNTIAYVNPELECAVVEESTLENPCTVRFINMKSNCNSEVIIHHGASLSEISFFGQTPVIKPILLKYQLDNFCGDGRSAAMYGILFVPPHTEEDNKKKWPTLHYVYGGPGVRMVENRFLIKFYMYSQLLAHFGIALLVCDGRGSGERGLDFEGRVKYQMGLCELEDQVFFLNKAAKDTGYIDLNRVGISGSSYGGYMSIMGMLNFSNIYKCGFSCSPVTNWLMYDTAYTERYMGLPQKMPQKYESSSVFTYLRNLPRDKCRLVIAHGGNDENVHFRHSASFIEYANNFDLDIRFMLYPSSRHGIDKRLHLDSHLIHFLLQHMKL